MLIPNRAIVIPTLSRWDSLITTKHYPDALLVVEPHEKIKYDAAGSNERFVVLPQSGQGISFVRNYILHNAEGLVGMLDDDLSYFGTFREKKKGFLYYNKQPSSPQDSAEACFRALEDGYDFVSTVFKGKSSWPPAKRIFSYVFMNAPKLRKSCQYDNRTDLFEDFDFQLQVLKAGFKVGILTKYTWGSATVMGENEGGLHDYRKRVKSNSALDTFLRKWPFADVSIKGRGVEPKINWQKSGFKVDFL